MKIWQKVKMVVLAVAIMAFGLAPLPVFAACDSNCDGCPNAAEQAKCFASLAEGGNSNELLPTIQNILNVVFTLVGIIAVIVLVFGGIQYTISAGDAGKVKKAKDTILYGVVGLIVTLLAAAIVNFVLAGVFSAPTA